MKTKIRLKSGLALLLTLVMLFSVMTPMMSFTATALTVDTDKVGTNTKLTSKTDYAVAPGITESHIITHNKDGSNQIQAYALEIDLSNPNVGLIASYKDYMNDLAPAATWGMQTVRDQAAAAESYHKNDLGKTYFEIVGGINCDFFNMQTGEPTGSLVMNGTVYKETKKAYFAILNDGSAVIGKGKIPANAVEVVGGEVMLVENGIINPNIKDNKDKFPRTSIGLTADGRVILVTADGRQAPSSCGQTFEENAQQLLSLGCVTAMQVDGGGSATIVSQREGETSLSVRNSPSDGVERTVSTSLLVYSNATPDGQFDHANLSPVNELYTPGSTVTFSATAVDGAGASAELPADGYFALADAAAGTIDPATGVFTAAEGYVGDVVVNYMVGEFVKGTTTVSIVIPDELYVASTEQAVGPGVTTDFGITAKYQDREVEMKAGDISWDIYTSEYLNDENRIYAYFYKDGFDEKYLKNSTYGTKDRFQPTEITGIPGTEDYVVLEMLAATPNKGSKYQIAYLITNKLDKFVTNGDLAYYSKYKNVALDENAGKFDGLTFTGAEEGAYNTTIRAKLNCNTELDPLVLTVFIGSKQVPLYDFEYVTGEENKDAENYVSTFNFPTYSATWLSNNGSSNAAISAELYEQDIPLYIWPNAGVGDTNNTTAKATVVSAQDGEPVRFGDKSLRIQFDYGNYNFQKNANFYLRTTSPMYKFEGSPTAVGCWVYAPEGTTAYHLYLQVAGKVNPETGSSVTSYQCVTTPESMGDEDGKGICWNGWRYLEFDLTGIKGFTGSSNVGGAYEPYGMYQSNGVFWISYQPSNMGTTVTADTIYIDDITLIYGGSTMDTHNPEVTYIGDLSERIVDGETVYTSNTNTFKAQYADFDDKYMTGIDDTATKMYIDGVDVTDKCYIDAGNDEIYFYDAVLPDGEHVIEIEVADGFGNKTSEMCYFTIASETEDTEISFEAANTPVLGEDFILNIVTNNASDIAAADIEVKILSNFTRYWRDVEVVPAQGFRLDGEAVYNAIRDTLTFRIVREEASVIAEGEDLIASIITKVPSDTPEKLEVTHRISKGAITYLSGETSTISAFSGKIVSSCEAPLVINIDTMLVGSAGGNIYVTDNSGNPIEAAKIYDYRTVGKFNTTGSIVTPVDISAESNIYVSYSNGYILKGAKVYKSEQTPLGKLGIETEPSSAEESMTGMPEPESTAGKLTTEVSVPAHSFIYVQDAAGTYLAGAKIYADDILIGVTDANGKFTVTADIPAGSRIYTVTAEDVAVEDGTIFVQPCLGTTDAEGKLLVNESLPAGTGLYAADATGAAINGGSIYADYFLGNTDTAGKLFTTAFVGELKEFSLTASKTVEVTPADPENGVEAVYKVLRSFTFKSQSYESKGDITGLPSYIKLNATEDTSTQQSISWMSNPLATAGKAVVRYILKSEYDAYNDASNDYAGYTEYRRSGTSYLAEMKSSGLIANNYAVRLNSVVLTDLKPGTEYVYFVGDGTTWSEAKTFTTQRSGVSTDFFIFADIQTTTTDDVDIVNQALANTGIDFDFGVHTGDIVDNAGDYAYWEAAGKAFSTGVLGSTDIFHTLGNHEYTGDYYGVNATHYYDLPGSHDEAPEAYSVDFGNIYMASFGFLGMSGYRSAIEWLREDIANTNATWKILLVHQPPYYTNPGGATKGYRELITAAADELDLDFVFSGHDHAFARTQPITGGLPDEENGTVYYVCGSVGGKGYDFVDEPAHYYATHMDYKDYNAVYMTANVTDTEFTINAYASTDDNKEFFSLIDTYTATKDVDCTDDGHDYVLNEGWLTCSVCDYTIPVEGYTGLAKDAASGLIMKIENGEALKNIWVDIDGAIYYFGADGVALAGTQKVGEYEYPFDESGVLTKFAIVKDGALVANWWTETADGVYYLGADGLPATGDTKIGDYTYPLDETGKLTKLAFVKDNGTLGTHIWLTNPDSGKLNYLGESGLPVTGANKISCNTEDGKTNLTYTFDENGDLVKGAFSKSGIYTYYWIAGLKQRNWFEIDGYWYYFDRQTGYGMATLENDGKISADKVKDGKYPISSTDSTLLFTFDKNGRLVEGALYETENGTVYYWGNNERLKGWHYVDGDIYYFGDDFYAVTGEQTIDEKAYTFSAEGKLQLKDENFEINGTFYYYDVNGVIVKDHISTHPYTKAVIDAVAPDCDDTGLTAGEKCSVCDFVLIAQEKIDKDGHKHTPVVTPPTCTDKGYTTYTCSVCGDTYTADEVAANGHTPGEWTVVTPADIGIEGLEQLKCTVCNAVLDSKKIDALEPPTTEPPTTEPPTTEPPTTEPPTTEPDSETETTTEPVVYYKVGDANRDGKITAADARIALRYAAKIDVPATSKDFIVADVNFDNKINALDARKILRVAAGLDKSF